MNPTNPRQTRKKTKKAQSSIEFLTTYGWIVIVMSAVAVILWQAGTFNPVPCEKRLMGFSQAMPTDWAAYRNTDTLVINVENWAGGSIKVTEANAVIEAVTCTATPDVEIAPGETSLVILDCSGDPGLSGVYRTGQCYRAVVEMTYVNQRSGYAYNSNGNLRGAVEEGVVTTTTTTTTTTIVDNTPPVIVIDSPPDGASIVVQA